MDEKVKLNLKSSSDYNLLEQIVSYLSSFFILIGFFYCYSTFEPQVFFDWYFKYFDNISTRELSFLNAYVYSIDPARNFIFRLLDLNSISAMWKVNLFIGIAITVNVLFLIKYYLIRLKLKTSQLIFLSLLLIFNLSFYRLLYGSQNMSILVGVFFFTLWQNLYLYFSHNRKFFLPLLVVTSWANLLLLPLTLFGLAQYYIEEKDRDNRITIFVLFMISFSIPLLQKFFILRQDHFYILGNPVEPNSYIEFSYGRLNFKENLLGVFGSLGKVIFPLGTRQFYSHLSLVDYLGFGLVITYLSFLFTSLRKEKYSKRLIVSLILLLLFCISWPLFYRSFFILDKISGLHSTTSVFFQGINNDDLISFYIISLVPLFLFLKNIKSINNQYLFVWLIAQTFFVGAYAPKLFKTESYVLNQLEYEPNNEILNLSYLFFANENRENFNQDQVFKYKVNIDRSENEKLKFLGNFFYKNIEKKFNYDHLSVNDSSQIKRYNFHPWILVQIYLYYQNFNELRLAQYAFFTNDKLRSTLRTRFSDRVIKLKNDLYLDTLLYLGQESIMAKNKDNAIKYYVLAYYLGNDVKVRENILRKLALVTEVPIDDLIERTLNSER